MCILVTSLLVPMCTTNEAGEYF